MFTWENAYFCSCSIICNWKSTLKIVKADQNRNTLLKQTVKASEETSNSQHSQYSHCFLCIASRYIRISQLSPETHFCRCTISIVHSENGFHYYSMRRNFFTKQKHLISAVSLLTLCTVYTVIHFLLHCNLESMLKPLKQQIHEVQNRRKMQTLT